MPNKIFAGKPQKFYLKIYPFKLNVSDIDALIKAKINLSQIYLFKLSEHNKMSLARVKII